MTDKKNLNAGKQTDKSQDKFADERLNDDELDKIAGGTGGEPELPYLKEPQSFVGGK